MLHVHLGTCAENSPERTQTVVITCASDLSHSMETLPRSQASEDVTATKPSSYGFWSLQIRLEAFARKRKFDFLL